MSEKEMIQEMIQEMASDMNFACVELSKEQRLEIARVLINLGYCQRPEGSVMLQQKDLIKLQNAITQSCNSKFDVDVVNYLTNTVEALENKLKELEEQRDRQAYITEELIQEKHRWTEKARKEMAKEILKELMGHTFENDGWTWTIVSKDDILWLAEKYGVKVEE